MKRPSSRRGWPRPGRRPRTALRPSRRRPSARSRCAGWERRRKACALNSHRPRPVRLRSRNSSRRAKRPWLSSRRGSPSLRRSSSRPARWPATPRRTLGSSAGNSRRSASGSRCWSRETKRRPGSLPRWRRGWLPSRQSGMPTAARRRRAMRCAPPTISWRVNLRQFVSPTRSWPGRSRIPDGRCWSWSKASSLSEPPNSPYRRNLGRLARPWLRPAAKSWCPSKRPRNSRGCGSR